MVRDKIKILYLIFKKSHILCSWGEPGCIGVDLNTYLSYSVFGYRLQCE